MSTFTAEMKPFLLELSKEELVTRLLTLSQDFETLQANFETLQMKYDQQSKDMTAMGRQYANIEKKNQDLSCELEDVKKALKHEMEKNSVFTRAMFDSKAETMPDMNADASNAESGQKAQAEAQSNEMDGDAVDSSTANEGVLNDIVPTEGDEGSSSTGASSPKSDNEEQEASAGPDQKDAGSSGNSKKEDGRHTGNRGPKKNNLRDFMKSVPSQDVYHIDAAMIAEMDARYGENNWRIITYECTSHLETIPKVIYVKNDYRPVIEVLEDGMKTLIRTTEECPFFYPHSVISPSFFASIVTEKCRLSLPLYRQSSFMESLLGDALDRSSMARALIKGSEGFALPVYEYIRERLIHLEYSQSDETTIVVLENGATRHVSYLWCHVSGELRSEDPRIAFFAFEKTRNADHLRNLFSESFLKVLSSDAYAGYGVLGKETEAITISNCWTHCRRPVYQAFRLLIDVAGITDETVLRDTCEYKLLSLISKIYELDTPLKSADPETRKNARQSTIKPLVDEFFDLAKKMDSEDPTLSYKMKEALVYIRNQESALRVFLDDPFVPIDNSYTERTIRPVTIGRRNWLFADTYKGAVALAVYYTLVTTATMNGADPYFYIRYLCEKVPGGILGPVSPLSKEFLESLMPWSEQYKAYEKAAREELFKTIQFTSGPKPDVEAMRQKNQEAAA